MRLPIVLLSVSILSVHGQVFIQQNYDTRSYNFSPQHPGGSVTAGSNTIRLTPCPMGVSGAHTVAANTPHLLFISGGSGTAEAVSITGGTCTPGASSGTVVITAVYAHSGAWAISSNSDGMQEAIYAAGVTGRVQLPCSTVNLWGNTATLGAVIVPDGYNTSVRGCGMRETTLFTHFTTGDAVVYDFVTYGGSVDTGDYQIMDVGGSNHSSGTALRIRHRADGLVSNILLSSMYDSIWAEGSNRVVFANLTIYNQHLGFNISCSGQGGNVCTNQVTLVNPHIITTTTSGVGMVIEDQTTGIIVDNPFIEGGTSSIGANMVALKINAGGGGPTNEIIIHGGFLDSHSTCLLAQGGGAIYNNNSIQLVGVHIACSSYGVMALNYIQNLKIQDSWIGAALGGVPANAGAIALAGHTQHVIVSNSNLETDGQACFYISGGNNSDLMAVGNVCGRITQPGNGINISGTSSTLEFRSNAFSSSGAVYVASTSPTGLILTDNTGIDDISPSVASASTLAFPVNPNFKVSGTTGIGAVTHPLAAGAHGTMITTDGAVAFTAGATIGNSLTTTQNVPVFWMWDGTKVWLQ